MDERIVRINAGEGYEVLIGPGLIGRSGETLKAILGPCAVAVITDETVEKLYLGAVLGNLERAGFRACSHAFAPGEQSKSLATFGNILEFLAENRLTRGDCVIALGGGVVGDLAGFAAGCYMRGIRYVQMPTTLLAAVDSSVGGKTGVDLKAGKNLAGLFLQPKAVLCDTDCLGTLPEDILLDGAAEAVKTGVLAGEALFSMLEDGLIKPRLPEIIAACVAYKGMVVEEDEFEIGPRRLLNLGHTVGHAVELVSGYAISHGRAVSMGLAIIARAAYRLGLCDDRSARRITQTLARLSLPVQAPFSAQTLAKAALSDKKRLGGDITLVMPHGIGDCCLIKVPVAELEAIIEAGMEDTPWT